MDDISEKQKNRTKPRIKKTLEQQLASAQMRLNRLQHKSKQETKQIETRQKIILGAEVLGMLLEIPNLHPDDKVRFRKNGLLFLASIKGRKT